MPKRVRTIFWYALPMGLFFLMHEWISRIHTLHLNQDEGENLMLSFLLTKGFHLYKQIWADQPPVFFLLVAGQFKAFGPSVEAGRYIALSLSVIMLGCLYRLLSRLDSVCAGIIAIALVMVSDHFIFLSSAAMIGLPSVALGVIALWAIVEWRESPSFPSFNGWLAVSAILMTFSVQSKLLSVTLLPALLVFLILPHEKMSWAHPIKLRAAAAWIGLFLLATLFIALLIREDGRQLLLPALRLRHEATEVSPLDPSFSDFFWEILWRPLLLVPLAITGLLFNLSRRRWHVLIPLAWFAVSTAILIRHQPIRFHYAPLFTIPLCWCAALGGSGIFNVFKAWSRHVFHLSEQKANGLAAVAGSFLFVAFINPTPLRQELQQLWDSDREDRSIVARLLLYKNQTHWIYSDLPIYPFAAGLASPPELALPSVKRQQTGFLSDAYLCEMLKKYQPEQLLIGRLSYGHDVTDYLAKNYVQVWQSEGNRYQPVMRQYLSKLSDTVEQTRS